MKNIAKLLSKDKNPQLYSKRGLEKKRIKGIVIPDKRDELCYILDIFGNKIVI